MANEIRKEYKTKKKALKKDYKASKRNYKTSKKELKQEYNDELDLYYSSSQYLNIANPPRRSVLEEIGNATTHGVGAAFAIVAFILMLRHASTHLEYVSTFIYFFGLFFMFTISCIYHSFKYGLKVKRIFRRFDYSSIYLLIASTFTPILLCFLGGAYGIVFASVLWGLAITGITFVAIFGPHRLRWLHIPLYCLMGWSALLFVPKMINNNLPFFFWVLSGGVAYSLGIIPFAIKKKVSHFIWHFFVLIGAILQWVGIYLYIFLR